MRATFTIAAGLLAVGVGAQCCDYTLSMLDSYGDGWNGGVVEVEVNGTGIGSFSASGYGSSALFTVCTGDAVDLIYTAGDWENENSYWLTSGNGAVIWSDGPDPGTGTVFSTSGDCVSVPAPGSAPCAPLPIDTTDCVTVNNTGVAGTGISPGCGDYAGGDLWFAMAMTASRNVQVSTASTGGLDDTAIALWTGPDCSNLTLRACDDDGGPGQLSWLSLLELPATDSLYIQAFGYGGGTGPFDVCVTDPGMLSVDSSELPIVLIHALGQAIPVGQKIDALMEVKFNGPGSITHLADPSNVYDGHIGIEVRGATSSGYPQRPYNVETRDSLGVDLDVPLLGMPEENDWFLLSNYNDRSFVRNALAFDLSRRMGQWAPRTHLCEVLVDSAYRGVYVLGERVKRDGDRVDIAKLTPTEISGENLTGGYILEQNLWSWDNSFQSNWSPIDHPGFDIHFIYKYPDPDSIAQEQKDYIAAYVDSLETALYAPDFADPVTGYRKYLDVPSFITYFLVNELARNNDGFKKSRYWHKDKHGNGGLLKAGPVWDFDWAWKDLWGCEIFENTDGSGWAHRINDCPTDNYGCGWYVRLLQDSVFAGELRCAYDERRADVLSESSINAFIDSVGALVQNAQARHFQRWPILGMSGPAPEVGAIATTYSAELDTLKAWIAERLDWLDANIPGLCLVASVQDIAPVAGLEVHPDPTDGRFTVSVDPPVNGPAELTIRDMTGRIVQRQGIRAGTTRHFFHVATAGTYVVSLTSSGGLLAQRRVSVVR